MKNVLKILFSPSRAIIDWWKKKTEGDEARRKEVRGKKLRIRSKDLFAFESLLAVVLFATNLAFEQISIVVSYILAIYAYSRVNEIAYAFVRDAISKLKENQSNSDLLPEERILMAMRSYYGLALNFAIWFVSSQEIMQQHFSKCLFNNVIGGYFESMYFSVVTITTLGYGEIHPVHWISKASVMYEVFAGLLLLVVAFAIYMSQLRKKNT